MESSTSSKESISTFEVEASNTLPPEKIYNFFTSSKKSINYRINNTKGIQA